jgi:nucleoid DNA-binding protein
MTKKSAKKKPVVTRPRKKAKVTSSKKITSITKSYTKTDLLNFIAKRTDLPRKKVDEVIETVNAIMHAHIKSGCPFSLPGQFKVTVVKKPATKQREGINPFTGELATFKAKPARKVVKLKALKKLKAAV